MLAYKPAVKETPLRRISSGTEWCSTPSFKGSYHTTCAERTLSNRSNYLKSTTTEKCPVLVCCSHTMYARYPVYLCSCESSLPCHARPPPWRQI